MTANEALRLLGLKVRERVTGFTGIVTAVSFDLPGCIQVAVVPRMTGKNGKAPDAAWYDANRLEVIDSKPAMAVPSFGQGVPDKGPVAKPHVH